MSAGWIKLRDLRTHPKVKAVAVRLGVRRGDIIGALTGLWHDADQHAVGDLLPHLTAEVIDADAEIPGFADALVAIGWIVITPDGVTLPRYEEHNGETAKKRAEKNKRQARYRGGRRDGGAGASTTAPHSRLPEEIRGEEKREEKKEPNGSSTSQPEPATRKFSSSDWDQKFSRRMFADISSIVPSAKRPSFDAWANEIRLMRESDHRTEAEIESLWSWTSRDSFWQANVLSPKKFREKWPQLCAKRDAQSRAGPPRATQDKFAGNREFLERMKAKDAPNSIQPTNGTTHGGNGQRLLE